MASQVPITPDAPPRVAGQTYWDKGWEKCKQQPFVPLGVLATCVALIGASAQFRTGNRESFNRFLRFRVVAQGVTVAACVVGSVVYTKEAAIQKGIARQEELEKIRVAGTRSAAAENTVKATVEAPEPATSSTPPSDTPPATPVTTDELMRRWGVKSGGKT